MHKPPEWTTNAGAVSIVDCEEMRETTMTADTRPQPLEDSALLSEIELLTDIIIAATHCAGPLPQADIDAALGLGGGPA